MSGSTVMAPGSGSGSGGLGSGAELLRDVQAAAGAFERGDWLGGGLGVVRVALDVLDVAGDPLGAIGSAGVGWVLGAVSFLREPFEVLAGDSGAISSSAGSWRGCGADLAATADDYRRVSVEQTRSWAGTAADGYRAASGNQADGLAALASAKQAVAGAMTQGGQAVARARQTVLELISQAVGKIIQICLDALAKSWLSFGASVALGIARSVQQAVQTARKLAGEIQQLVQTLQKIIQIVQQVVQIARQIKQLVELIGGKASGEQPHTLSAQQVTSTGAMATDTAPTGGATHAAPARSVAPGYQHQTLDTAGADGTGATHAAPARSVAPGYQHHTPDPAGAHTTAGATTSQQATTTGPVTTPGPMAGTHATTGVQTTTPQHLTTTPLTPPPPTARGGVPTTQTQPPPGTPTQTPPAPAGQGRAPAGDPSRWPAPPAGVPSWGPTGPPPERGTGHGREQLQAWVDEARQVLVNQGVDPSLMNSDQMVRLIQHESSGNPYAINLWDSNATAGHPSKGLMQTIDSTFSEHHLPGYDNIYAPVDNIIAGTRYAIDRYGSISNVPGVRALANGRDYVGY